MKPGGAAHPHLPLQRRAVPGPGPGHRGRAAGPAPGTEARSTPGSSAPPALPPGCRSWFSSTAARRARGRTPGPCAGTPPSSPRAGTWWWRRTSTARWATDSGSRRRSAATGAAWPTTTSCAPPIAAEKLPYVEPGHTCAAGASYGGYMIDWIAGHTDRFKCLVSPRRRLRPGEPSTAPPRSSGSRSGSSAARPGTNPELYRQAARPAATSQNFKTPTLVVQGELDFRVPVEQGLGMFTALQRRGVESRLLYFPDEGHWVLKPKNSQLWYHTVLDWIRRPRKGRKQAGLSSVGREFPFASWRPNETIARCRPLRRLQHGPAVEADP